MYVSAFIGDILIQTTITHTYLILCFPSKSFSAVFLRFSGNEQKQTQQTETPLNCYASSFGTSCCGPTIPLCFYMFPSVKNSIFQRIVLVSLFLVLSACFMGANLSAFFSGLTWSDRSNWSSGSSSLQSKPSLGDLPESCVALVLGYLDPPEICKLARLNRAFRGASWADFVWESKLPYNYQVLVTKVFGELPGDLGKREIYARLCRTNTFDGDTKVLFFLLFFFFFFLFRFWGSRGKLKVCPISIFSNCFNWLLFRLLGDRYGNFFLGGGGVNRALGHKIDNRFSCFGCIGFLVKQFVLCFDHQKKGKKNKSDSEISDFFHINCSGTCLILIVHLVNALFSCEVRFLIFLI